MKGVRSRVTRGRVMSPVYPCLCPELPPLSRFGAKPRETWGPGSWGTPSGASRNPGGEDGLFVRTREGGVTSERCGWLGPSLGERLPIRSRRPC